MTRIRSYSHLVSLPTFEDRFEYLKLSGSVGMDTFGSSRYLNQAFYTSREWRDLRHEIIIRDDGCDLAIPDRPIQGKIFLHHMNPITEEQLIHKEDNYDYLLDPENLVCVSFVTHNAIHFGDASVLFPEPVERRPNDTCPWKGGSL